MAKETLTDPAALSKRLLEIAPLTDHIQSIAQFDDGAWALGFEDDTVVTMEWARNPERVVLSATLGTPPSGRETEVFETALSYTALWQESGGAKVAKGGGDGELILIRELHPELEDGWELLPVLEHFSNVAAWWKHYVSIAPATDAASRATPLDVLQLRA
jgi:hypothetical protein